MPEAGFAEQSTQLGNSRTYDDTLTPGAALETPAAGSRHLEFDMNAVRSLLKAHGGRADWFLAPEDSFSLQAIHDKIICYQMPALPGTSDFTLVGGEAGVLTPATMYAGGAGTIAVGPASPENGGYVAADEANFAAAGALGVGLSTALDGDGVLLNRVAIIDDDTNEPPSHASGANIFGLLHAVTGTADGAAIAANPNENLQISFVYYDPATDVLTSATLPAGTYHFAPIRQRDFHGLNRGFGLEQGGMPSVVDPGSQAAKIPMRTFSITGTAPAAADPMTITNGTFVTAGAQTQLSSHGTPALPATGALFRDDPRIKVWVNGILVPKVAAPATGLNVARSSATQIEFGFPLFGGNHIHLELPSAY